MNKLYYKLIFIIIILHFNFTDISFITDMNYITVCTTSGYRTIHLSGNTYEGDGFPWDVLTKPKFGDIYVMGKNNMKSTYVCTNVNNMGQPIWTPVSNPSK